MLLSLLLVFCYFINICTAYAKFNNDYKIIGVTLDAVSQEYADRLVEIDQDMPMPCRRDVCFPSRTKTERKGEFLWPSTPITHKVELRCPFSFDIPVYTTRICGLSMEGKAEWKPANFQAVCPDPPLAELLKVVTKEIEDRPKDSTVNENITMYSNIISKMYNVLHKYRDTPINKHDVNNLLNVYYKAIDFLDKSDLSQIKIGSVKEILGIYSIVMDDDIRKLVKEEIGEIWKSLKHILKILVERLPYRIERTRGETLEILLPNLAMYVMDISNVTANELKISDGFLVSNDQYPAVYSPNVSLHVNGSYIFGGKNITISVTILRKSTLDLKDGVIWEMHGEEKVDDRNVTSVNNGDRYEGNNASSSTSFKQTTMKGILPFFARIKSKDSPSLTEDFPPAKATSTAITFPSAVTATGNSGGFPSDLNSDMGPGSNPDGGETSSKNGPAIPEDNKTVSTTESSPQKSCLREISSFGVIGSTIFVTSFPPLPQDVVDILYQVYNPRTLNISNIEQVCLKSHEKEGTLFWTNKGCSTLEKVTAERYTSCKCNGIGRAFGVHYERFPDNRLDFGTVGSAFPKAPPVEKGDISSFLGFQYKQELEILGNVLGAISLACLMATVISYVAFRKARKGTPTRILLNLCMALIALSVLIFGIHLAADVMNITGCTVSNALRYYLVFVTLVWNGIEAFNLYLMLVKVFGAEISRFMLKAGIVAWGTPALMVIVCFAVNKKSFNGKYILVSEDLGTCEFRCQLNHNMLYYGYLIPMAVIITHNLIMFGFVLKIIFKHGNKLGKAKKRNKLVQLCGAVATLVLLGVPWIFSAFGAIDATGNDNLAVTEGVFQVVFVVFVNLQGVFIFLFHCARNDLMRQSWSSVISRSGTKSSRLGSTNQSSNSLSTQASNLPSNGKSLTGRKKYIADDENDVCNDVTENSISNNGNGNEEGKEECEIPEEKNNEFCKI